MSDATDNLRHRLADVKLLIEDKYRYTELILKSLPYPHKEEDFDLYTRRCKKVLEWHHSEIEPLLREREKLVSIILGTEDATESTPPFYTAADIRDPKFGLRLEELLAPPKAST